jgi:predicted RNase H-like nuclease (RuvC/YqgF family)
MITSDTAGRIPMNMDRDTQKLHDRATRGESLTAAERDRLDRWYAQHDLEEADTLTKTFLSTATETLRAQVDAAVEQLRVLTAQIQEQGAENQTLRQEVAALKNELAQKSKKQPA